MGPSSRDHRGATAALTLLAFALRLGWGLAVRVPPAWDGVLYERGARALASGLGYSCFMFGPRADPGVPTAYYPVGYSAWLAGFYLALGAAPWVVALAGALPGALTVGLAHRLSLRVGSPRAALLASLALALLPGQVLFASVPMTETLWGAQLALAVYLLTRRDAPRTWELLAAGVTLAAATYVRPQAAMLAPALPLLLAAPWRERLRRAALVTAVTVALVVPWSVRNCALLDGCAFVSTNGGGNLAIGAIPRATGTYRPLSPSEGCGPDVGRGVIREAARDACWRAVAVRHVRADPARWLRLGVAKLHHTFAYEAYPAGYLRQSRPDLVDAALEVRLRRALTASWRALGVLALLALLPLYPRRSLGSVGALSLVTIALIGLTHVLVFGGDRYHLPLAPLVAVLASGAWRGLPWGSAGPRGADPE